MKTGTEDFVLQVDGVKGVCPAGEACAEQRIDTAEQVADKIIPTSRDIVALEINDDDGKCGSLDRCVKETKNTGGNCCSGSIETTRTS